MAPSPEAGKQDRRATLTFDNGPDAAVTPAVLDALARRGIRATFFVVGERLADPGHRRLAEQARAEGHWIGNHSMTHATPLGEEPGAEAARREIVGAQEALGPLAHPDRLFRPFGGGGNLDARLLSPEAVGLLCQGGYTCVLWNAVPRDWEDAEGWPERALAQVGAQAWSNVVLHDIAGGAMARLDAFLGRLADAGVRLVQEFPPETVPILRGKVVGSLDGLVACPSPAAP